MPRRPPPTPLVLAKGPIPPRGTPRHQLPDVPRAALIVAEPSQYPCDNTTTRLLQFRERSASNASTSSLCSNFSFSSSSSSSSFSVSPSYDPPLVSTSTRMRVISSGMMMSSSWVALEAARRQIAPPPPVMLAYPSIPISRGASGSTMKTKGELTSRRVSF